MSLSWLITQKPVEVFCIQRFGIEGMKGSGDLDSYFDRMNQGTISHGNINPLTDLIFKHACTGRKLNGSKSHTLDAQSIQCFGKFHVTNERRHNQFKWRVRS